MKRILLPLLMYPLLMPAFAQAQEDQVSKTVEVLRAYDPTLSDAYKINQMPRVDDTAKLLHNFTYTLRSTKSLTDNYLLTPIPPARIQKERYEPDEKVHAYLRLGLGFKVTALLDAYAGSEGKDYSWQAKASYYGSYGKVKKEDGTKVATRDVRDNIGISGQKNFEHGELAANLDFGQHWIRYYGYATDEFTSGNYKDMSTDSLRQLYNRTAVGVSYKGSGLPDSSWAYGANFNFHDFRSKHNHSEDRVGLNLYATKQFRPTTIFGLDFDLDIYARSSALGSNDFCTSLTPSAKEIRDMWEATARLNLEIDNSSGRVKFHPHPTLNFTLLLADKSFMPYAEITGGREVNTYEKLATENPYLHPYANQDFSNTEYLAAFSLGFKARYSSVVSCNMWISYSFVDDLYLFVNSKDGLGSYFEVEHDDTKIFSYNTYVALKPLKALDVNLKYTYNGYDMDKVSKAYNRPAHNLILQGRYNLWNKVACYANLRVNGKYAARNAPTSYSSGTEVVRKAGADLSLGGEYRFFDRSSAFVQMNNLFASRYQIFNGYPTYGFNMMIGYTCLF
ncbi:MAG: hypothetical protein LBK47_03020 [Prevotellaceae bacterium]|jgi:hypothetical protein|nr:hypothetical protein [Prevotellaceae bacterium]